MESHLKMLKHKLTEREQCDTVEAVLHVFALDCRQLPSQSGDASRAHVAELMLPLPTCSQCALQRKASH